MNIEGKLTIRAAVKDGLTYPEKVYCAAPYKLTNFFRLSDGGIEYMLMNSSAGIMAGDRYNLEIELEAGSSLSLISQSYEKIHKMDEGSAGKTTMIKVAENAFLKYFPLPVIPFAGSSFNGKTSIFLQNTSSKLIYADILSSGRYHNNERFRYDIFKSLTEVRVGDRLVLRENCSFKPEESAMDSIGLYERFNVMGNLFVFGFSIPTEKRERIANMIFDSRIETGMTELPGGGLFIRAFVYESDELNTYFRMLVSAIEKV